MADYGGEKIFHQANLINAGITKSIHLPGKKNKLLTFQSHKMHSVTKCIYTQKKMSRNE